MQRPPVSQSVQGISFATGVSIGRVIPVPAGKDRSLRSLGYSLSLAVWILHGAMKLADGRCPTDIDGQSPRNTAAESGANSLQRWT